MLFGTVTEQMSSDNYKIIIRTHKIAVGVILITIDEVTTNFNGVVRFIYTQSNLAIRMKYKVRY